MNKNRLGLHLAAILAIAFFAFLAISSATKPYVVNEDVPLEESVTIGFHQGPDNMILVTSYNGIPVPTRRESGNRVGKTSDWAWRPVILPAGEIELVFDAAVEAYIPVGTFYGSIPVYIFRDVKFTYTYEPGTEYWIKFQQIEKDENGNWDNDKMGLILYKNGEEIGVFPYTSPGKNGRVLE